MLSGAARKLSGLKRLAFPDQLETDLLIVSKVDSASFAAL
jgi:hypothetical protein